MTLDNVVTTQGQVDLLTPDNVVTTQGQVDLLTLDNVVTTQGQVDLLTRDTAMAGLAASFWPLFPEEATPLAHIT